MFDLIRAFDSVDLNSRKVVDLKDVRLIVDPVLEGYLTKIVDKKNNVISPVIRGFETISDLNSFLEDRFGIKVDENLIPYIKGNVIPRFKEMYIKQWERIN